MAIQRISSQIATSTTLTMPSHRAGDLLVAIAARTNVTPATVPSGWLQKQVTTATGISLVVAERISNGLESFGTWTNATQVAVVVYRSTTGKLLMLSSGIATGGTSTSITYSAIGSDVFVGTNNEFWVLGTGFCSSTGSNFDGDPTGLTNITTLDGGASELTVKDTNAVATSFSSTTFTASSSVTYRSITTAIMETVANIPVNINFSGGFQN